MKLEKQHIVWYFNLMKSRRNINENMEFCDWRELDNKVSINYQLVEKSREMRYWKRYSIVISKSVIATAIRDGKLSDLLR